jgi:hypothetical protein
VHFLPILKIVSVYICFSFSHHVCLSISSHIVNFLSFVPFVERKKENIQYMPLGSLSLGNILKKNKTILIVSFMFLLLQNATNL